MAGLNERIFTQSLPVFQVLSYPGHGGHAIAVKVPELGINEGIVNFYTGVDDCPIDTSEKHLQIYFFDELLTQNTALGILAQTCNNCSRVRDCQATVKGKNLTKLAYRSLEKSSTQR